ncbi:MAG: hypothetical protein AAGD96_32310, partial [Chloroflexota bacterium]
MNAKQIMKSAIRAAKLHSRQVAHLTQLCRAPSPVIRIAASEMLSELQSNSALSDFNNLQADFRYAGHLQIADTIVELAIILDSVIGEPQ